MSPNVYLGFERVQLGTPVEPFVQFICDKHVAIAMYVDTEDGNLSRFAMTLDCGFREEPLHSMSREKVQYIRSTSDFMHLPTTGEEHARILATCRACTKTRFWFNHYDLLLSIFPFRNPTDLSLFETQSLHDAQAVILILRECLDRESNGPLHALMHSLHSRTTLCGQLFAALPLTPCVRMPFRG